MIGERYSPQIIVSAALVLGSSLTLALLLGARSVSAQQLPVRTYTTADGLPRDLVLRIVRDSHDFLWFCTADGLSRFNGYEFTTYGVEHGLPHPFINDLLETRGGVYWVATNGGGVARFNPSPSQNEKPQNRNLFTAFPVGDEPTTSRVNVLYEDRAGQVWAGTDGGLFRLDESSGQATFRHVSLNLGELEHLVVVRALVEDREGSLWVSTQGLGLVRYLLDGRTVRYMIQPRALGDLVESLMFDPEGRLWVAHRGGAGLIVFKPEPASTIAGGAKLLIRTLVGSGCSARSPDERVRLPAAPGEVCRYTTADGLASDVVVGGIYQSSDGRIWIGTDGGLNVFSDGRFRSYTTAQGLRSRSVWPGVEDRDANLWLASATGAMKITWSGFTTFGKPDGLSNARVTSVFENHRGELCVTSDEVGPFISCFDDQRFTAVRPRLSREIKGFGWGTNEVTFQDHTGEWWIPTFSGLYRFPRVASVEQLAHIPPKAVYNHQRGELPGDDVFRLFEDSRGDIWISIAGAVHNVVRWERATESLHVYSEADGLPSYSPPTAYREDAAGNLWLGFYEGGLARYRDGHFRMFTQADGMPPGPVRTLYLDHAGRMWAATGQGGIVRVDDPQADRPQFVVYTTADGLSSNGVSCITEDKLGRMYFGTARGLDQFDLQTKRIRHYTKADGLGSNAITVAFRDRQGALWFGTELGLSRLIPGPDPPQRQPPILISGLRIAGDSRPISALGETMVSGLILNPSQNQLSIDFVGLGFAAGEGLKYQYKLVGANEDWSVPADQRTINYASLSAGSYRFMVRAVTADGIVSPTPATVAFTILPPIWQRWWFVTMIVLTVGLAIATTYRYRVRRLIELERVRTRIAADLHDDIGSGLSRIAILSEVARHQVNLDSPVREPLAAIAGASRDLVDSMSDIVWAINPNRDQLSDLVQRMRRFASDLFTAREIEFCFSAPDEKRALRLGADVRRQVFLIFKEAVNNIARHSHCTEAQIDLGIESKWLTMKVTDNGPGFEPADINDGQGLVSMRARAEGLGGELQINSNNGSGTTVLLRVPLAARVSSRDGRVR
jgi:ligand-binding sensor domain-containing protein/two-component sensor histidine kinase